MTLNVPSQAAVFNVECSVGMHTADLEMCHPTLWHSAQTFYTGGEPGKQVKHDLMKTNEDCIMSVEELGSVLQISGQSSRTENVTDSVFFFFSCQHGEKLIKPVRGSS